jgi:NADH:ubiquinone oxidoreductase subunit 4 (subunit M)
MVVFFASFSMILGAVYTLWTYNRIFFGNLKNLTIVKSFDLTRKEVYLFSILSFLVLYMGIYSSSILETLHSQSLNILEQAKKSL